LGAASFFKIFGISSEPEIVPRFETADAFEKVTFSRLLEIVRGNFLEIAGADSSHPPQHTLANQFLLQVIIAKELMD